MITRIYRVEIDPYLTNDPNDVRGCYHAYFEARSPMEAHELWVRWMKYEHSDAIEDYEIDTSRSFIEVISTPSGKPGRILHGVGSIHFVSCRDRSCPPPSKSVTKID